MTDKKTVWGESLPHLSFEELKELSRMVDTQLKATTCELMREKWKVIEDALKEWVTMFGPITVEGYERDLAINDNSDFSVPGRIGDL